jgi:hypothetical protein
MISISHKAKHFLLVLTKVLLVGLAFYYLYFQFQDKNPANFQFIALKLSLFSFIGIVLLSVLNWFFEILKWKNLVSSFHKISFKQAMEQSLGSLTASIFTPNRVGEYIAKCLYYSKEKSKRIIFLNFLGNFSQMLVTVLFGIVGLLFYFILSPFNLNFLIQESPFLFWLPILLVGVLLVFIFYFKRVEFYGYSIEKLKIKMQLFPARKHFVNVQYSFFRYVIFSHQFYFLLVMFQVEIPYPDAMLTIFTMYFLASIIPSIHLMDVVIKGSVAVFLFGNLGVNEWIILSVTMVMWLLNLVIPVIIGSFYVLKYNPNKTT